MLRVIFSCWKRIFMKIIKWRLFCDQSSVKGYHAYMDIWAPEVNEKLAALMETQNEVDKYAFVSRKKMLLSATYP